MLNAYQIPEEKEMTRKEARKLTIQAIARLPKRNVPGSRDAGDFYSLTAFLSKLVGREEHGDYAFASPRKMVAK